MTNLITMTNLEEARTLLSQRRQDLTRRLGTIERGPGHPKIEALQDPDDRRREPMDSEPLDRLSEVTHEELAQVLHALDRLESGHYGVCEHCGRNIGAARLHAVPDATSCAPCSGKPAA
jgi:RNA polymerase-binding transcription factor DksA